MNLSDLEIVLVGTRHAGNIGAVARVMKNMGLSGLTLINPSAHRHLDAIRMASGAEDIIGKASIFGNLEDGISTAVMVVGTTSRVRSLRKEVLTPEGLIREAAPLLSSKKRVAILFGPENFGLNNDEVRLCQFLVNIPTTQKNASLNLAQAVGIIAYEFNKIEAVPIKGHVRALINNQKKNIFYSSLNKTLKHIGFLNTAHPDRSMASVREIFERVGMNRKDFNILMGILKKIKRSIAMKAGDRQ